MPRKTRRRRRSAGRKSGGALDVVRQARDAAKKALDSLREEIRHTQSRLEHLLREERSFREELFGAARSAVARITGGGRPAGKTRAPRKGRRRPARRKGPPKAERYFQKLPKSFTLDDVRKVAGSASGVSIAQWSRAKRIRKSANGYRKTGK